MSIVYPEPRLLKILDENHLTVFRSGSWNLNIIGIRSISDKSNSFDDELRVIFKDDFGRWQELAFKITTDPGKYWLENPSRVAGTAILVGNKQYRGVYKIGKHKGVYEALVQTGGKVSVYRDSNKDTILDHDPENIQRGYFGINIHRSNPKRESTLVEKWSAGCQVFADPHDFEVFMSICKKAASVYGNSFTYTLLEDSVGNKIQ